MERPNFFEDEMVTGDFRSVRHEHHFKPVANGTIVIDKFYFETPYGAVGVVANKLFLKRYLEKLLKHRNNIVKDFAETTKWKAVLEHSPGHP